MPDEPSQRVEIPARNPRQRNEQIRLRPAGLKHGDAALCRFKEFPCAAEGESKRLSAVHGHSGAGRPARRGT